MASYDFFLLTRKAFSKTWLTICFIEFFFIKKVLKAVSKMASQSTGIQQLLVAETAAVEKVSDARKRKAKRLKQAKEEAQAEIEDYRYFFPF